MEFLQNRRSSENQKPPENRQKSGLFSEPRLLQCTTSLHTVNLISHRPSSAGQPEATGTPEQTPETATAFSSFLTTNAVVVNAVGGRNTQMSTNASLQKSAKGQHKSAPVKNCKQPGLKQPCLVNLNCMSHSSGDPHEPDPIVSEFTLESQQNPKEYQNEWLSNGEFFEF